MFSPSYKIEARESIKLAVPIIIAQLGVILMNVSDTIMIGRMLGKTDLAAAGFANSISFLLVSLAIGGLPVIAPIIAKQAATKNLSAVKGTFNNSIKIAIWYAVVLSLLGFILYLNLDLLGQLSIILNKSKTFFLIVIASNIPLIFFIAIKQTTDGLSLPKIAMQITFLGLLFNLLFNYILIPILGLDGAAYSTLLVRLIMCFSLFFYLSKSKYFREFRKLEIRYRTRTWQLMKLSIPGGLQFFFEIGAFAFAVLMMGWISENALAAHQIAISIAGTTYMMATGIAFAGGIRVGNAVGLKNITQIKTAANVSYLLVSVFMTISMILVFVFKEPLVRLYIDDPEILEISKILLTIAAIFQISDGIQVVALGNLRGLSDVKLPAYITFIAYWIVSLPLGYYLGFTLNWGAKGIWLALLIGLSLAALFLTIRFYRLMLRKQFI